MRAVPNTSSGRLHVAVQRIPSEVHYKRLLVPANRNGEHWSISSEVPEGPSHKAGPFLETPDAFDLALPFIIAAVMAAASATVVLVLTAPIIAGLRDLTTLLH